MACLSMEIFYLLLAPPKDVSSPLFSLSYTYMNAVHNMMEDRFLNLQMTLSLCIFLTKL